MSRLLLTREEYEEKAFSLIWEAHIEAGGHDFQDLCEGSKKVVADLLEKIDTLINNPNA